MKSGNFTGSRQRPALPTGHAFTLLELLVVMSVMVVLLALAISGASNAAQRSRASKCLGQLRQTGIAAQLYVAEHEGRLPGTGHVRATDGSSLSWINTLAPYLGRNISGRCPACSSSGRDLTYAWNDLLTEPSGEGFRVTVLRSPAATLLVAETADNHTSGHFHFAGARTRLTFNQFKSAVAIERHETHANYLFADAHAESLPPTEIKNRLSALDSAFLNP